MGQALYRKYRSKSLSEVVGQEHVTTTLTNALKQGRISHAYLFTGPRGTGKTSIARILAHEINNLPYEDESNHLDIIEIDAASNRRIDEIRELRDKVHIAPTSAKYKVYIIDEVHMLTREAFNALLKTLEEPPAHVVFMLATTEVHKLPETIISRVQRFSLKPVALDKVTNHLRSIAKSEGAIIDDDALELIAAHGEGSFRDSISLLDQARSQNEHVTIDDVRAMLGIPPAETISRIEQALTSHDPSTVVTELHASYEQGYNAARIAKQLGQSLRSGAISGKPLLVKQQLISLLEKLINVPSSSQPQQALELALLDIALKDSAPVAAATSPSPQPQPQAPISSESVEPTPPTPKQRTQKAEVAVAEQVIEQPATTAIEAPSVPPEAIPKQTVQIQVDETLWPQVVQSIKAQYNTLYSIARMAKAEQTDTGLRLHFSFAFHQKRMNEAKNKQIITDTIKQLTGESLSLECVVTANVEPTPSATVKPGPVAPVATKAAVQPAPENSEAVAAISSIFGGGEVLQA